ncbi:MAG: M24 family metallopeptidase, partial [Peptostreptococcaceae bacterium]
MNSKIEKNRELLKQKNVDALLLKGKMSKKYIGALTGSGVYVLITKDSAYQILDGRYIDEADKKTTGFINKVVPQGLYIPSMIELLKELAIKEVAIENQFMTIKEYISLNEASINVTLLTNELGKVRAIKSKDEIEIMRRACELTDEIFKEVIGEIKEGMTELEVSALLQYKALQKGATGMAFEPVVASGERGAMPHGRPTTKQLKINEAITIDFGIVYEGYQSDMTRTISIGEPPNKIKEIYDA